MYLEMNMEENINMLYIQPLSSRKTPAPGMIVGLISGILLKVFQNVNV